MSQPDVPTCPSSHCSACPSWHYFPTCPSSQSARPSRRDIPTCPSLSQLAFLLISQQFAFLCTFCHVPSIIIVFEQVYSYHWDAISFKQCLLQHFGVTSK